MIRPKAIKPVVKQDWIKRRNIESKAVTGYKVGRVTARFAHSFEYAGHLFHIHYPVMTVKDGREWEVSYQGVVISGAMHEKRHRSISWFVNRVDEFIKRFGKEQYNNELQFTYARGHQEMLEKGMIYNSRRMTKATAQKRLDYLISEGLVEEEDLTPLPELD